MNLYFLVNFLIFSVRTSNSMNNIILYEANQHSNYDASCNKNYHILKNHETDQLIEKCVENEEEPMDLKIRNISTAHDFINLEIPLDLSITNLYSINNKNQEISGGFKHIYKNHHSGYVCSNTFIDNSLYQNQNVLYKSRYGSKYITNESIDLESSLYNTSKYSFKDNNNLDGINVIGNESNVKSNEIQKNIKTVVCNDSVLKKIVLQI